MTRSPAPVLATLTVLTISAGANAQQDVAEVEFKNRAALHAAAPAVGTVVPDLVLVSLEGRPVALTSLRGQTVVLIRAGYTSQPFRDAVAGLRPLLQQFASSPTVRILAVVQAEPAAGVAPFESVAQPASLDERFALAERLRTELGTDLPLYVDGMQNESKAVFADLSSGVVLVDREGRIADELPTPDAAVLSRAVSRALRNAPTTRWPDSGPMPFDERDAAMRTADLDPAPLLRVNWVQAELQAMREPESEPDLQARRALTRAWLFRSRPESQWRAARDAVAPAIEAAWAGHALRRLAARVEFAELLATCGDGEGWADLVRKPSTGIDARVGAWIAKQHEDFEAPLLDFDASRRAEVRELRKCQPERGTSTILGIPKAFVRARFVPEGLLLLRGGERLGLKDGDVVRVDFGMPDDVKKLKGQDRTVLLSQSHVLVRYKSWLHAISDR